MGNFPKFMMADGIGAGAIELAGALPPKYSDSGGTGGTTEFMGHL